MARIQLSGLFLLVCASFAAATTNADDKQVVMTTEQQASFGVRVAKPELGTNSFSEKLPAKVTVPNAQLHVVSALQGGLVEKLLVAVGDNVKAGQPLAEIKSPDLVALERDFLQAQTQVKLARTNVDRDQQLAAEGIIARRRLAETQSTYQELATVVAQRREALRLAGVPQQAIEQLERRRTLSSSLTVTAPLDGTVLEQMITVGQRIDAATPLYRVGSLRPLWLDIHVPLERAAMVAIGDRVHLPEQDVYGVVTTIGREVHEADQGVLVRAEVGKGAESLRPGQFVQAQLGGMATAQKFYRVPRNAVVRQQQDAIVFVQSNNGFAPLRVKVGADQGEFVSIAADLPDSAMIAVSGTAALKAALHEQDH